MNEKNITDFPDGAEVFFLLKNSTLINSTHEKPEGFYVKGYIQNGKFIPSTGVLGIGELAKAGGRYGWLELNTKNFYPMESDRAAQTPFVKGYMKDNIFKPSQRDVYNTP